MTRFARGGTENTKRPLDATSWKELKSQKHEKNVFSPKRITLKHNRQSDVVQTADLKYRTSNYEHSDREAGPSKTTQLTAEQRAAIGTLYKREKRREGRRLKRIQKKSNEQVCYNCRIPGHTMAECPEAKRDMEQGTGICFKCGSTEHSSAQCKVKLPPGEFPYAKCFICGETGHLSKQCPDNPRGLYPSGGCCNICESVEHYQRDCPKRQEQEATKSGFSLTTWNTLDSVDDEPSLVTQKPPNPKKKSGPKTVKF